MGIDPDVNRAWDVRSIKLLLTDFKVAPDQLAHAFDVLKVSVGASKSGFESFSASAGPLVQIQLGQSR